MLTGGRASHSSSQPLLPRLQVPAEALGVSRSSPTPPAPSHPHSQQPSAPQLPRPSCPSHASSSQSLQADGPSRGPTPRRAAPLSPTRLAQAPLLTPAHLKGALWRTWFSAPAHSEVLVVLSRSLRLSLSRGLVQSGEGCKMGWGGEPSQIHNLVSPGGGRGRGWVVMESGERLALFIMPNFFSKEPDFHILL